MPKSQGEIVTGASPKILFRPQLSASLQGKLLHYMGLNPAEEEFEMQARYLILLEFARSLTVLPERDWMGAH